MKKSTNIDLGALVAIVFAAVVISGSLVFFGLQSTGASGGAISDAELDTRIDAGIERYVTKKTAEAEQQQADAVIQQAERSKDLAKQVPRISSDDHVFGNPDAKLTLIEYSDFQCPYCQAFHATARQVIEAYSDDVNWVYRHYPLSFHDPAATRQALASECVAELAGNDAFWEFGDVLFTQGPSDDAGLTAAAVKLGADETAFTECLESERYLSKIQQQTADGNASGVTGTPGNIVLNNETGEAILVEGAQPLSVFKGVIDQMSS